MQQTFNIEPQLTAALYCSAAINSTLMFNQKVQSQHVCIFYQFLAAKPQKISNRK